MSSNSVDDDFEPHSEDIDIKPWDLPYWRGQPPKTEVEEPPEVEEIEVQPEPLTVEEIEEIRNNAYDEGFLQGLNEGRDKGEIEGKESGFKQGQQDGQQQGEETGKKVGFEAGHAEGLKQGEDEITQAVEQLRSLAEQFRNKVEENDKALPHVISQLVKTACETILQRELGDGDRSIYDKIQHALQQLPSGEEHIKVFVSPTDAVHLEHGLARTGQELHFDVDDQLIAGSARIVSDQSLLEFSIKERMDGVFEHIEHSCQNLEISPADDLNSEVTEEISEPEPNTSNDASSEESPDAE